MIGANGGAEKIRFKGRLTMGVYQHEILILKKLLLPYTNPKIDRDTEGEFNPRMISQRSNLGDFLRFLTKLQNDSGSLLDIIRVVLG